ncbi:MAG: hypothetical protein QM813_09250 [Verrucomicrobiota bacterium]
MAATQLSEKDFQLLKDRLYRSKNALELVLNQCTGLNNFAYTMDDGRQVYLADFIEVIEAARVECKNHEPLEVQLRKIRRTLSQQPRG